MYLIREKIFLIRPTFTCYLSGENSCLGISKFVIVSKSSDHVLIEEFFFFIMWDLHVTFF